MKIFSSGSCSADRACPYFSRCYSLRLSTVQRDYRIGSHSDANVKSQAVEKSENFRACRECDFVKLSE
jgi:hypothetical protein